MGAGVGGEEPGWLGTEQEATFQGTLDRAWNATDRAQNWRATESERGAQAGPHALKAPSPSLFIFQGREFATLETLPEAWHPGNCLVMGAALTTLTEGTQQCRSYSEKNTHYVRKIKLFRNLYPTLPQAVLKLLRPTQVQIPAPPDKPRDLRQVT